VRIKGGSNQPTLYLLFGIVVVENGVDDGGWDGCEAAGTIRAEDSEPEKL
jgi:hypothetical protein